MSVISTPSLKTLIAAPTRVKPIVYQFPVAISPASANVSWVADACEVYSNPWSAVAAAGGTTLARIGVPMFSVTAAATHFWCQTRGARFVDPQANVGGDNGGLQAFWRHDGTLQNGETACADVIPTFDTNQPAGIVMAGSASGNGPLLNLTGL